MKRYLIRWKNDGIHSATLNIYGIHRLMRDKSVVQVCGYELADSLDIPPIPVRIYYDFKFDKVSLFSMSGVLIEKTKPLKSDVFMMGRVA